jgi:hypothetical protein
MTWTVKKAKTTTKTRKTDQPYTRKRTGACQAMGLVVPVFRPERPDYFQSIDFRPYEWTYSS